MTDIRINHEKCVECGLCVNDCSRGAITMVENKITIDLTNCNECAHCMAICPQNAIFMAQYDMEEIEEYSRGIDDVDADNFLNLIKFRRSIRHFKEKKIEPEKLEKILEAGRYSPTAGNRQTNRFIVINDRIDEIREMAITTLYGIATDMEFDLGGGTHYRKTWSRMYNDYKESGIDRLFYGAPAVVVITSDDKGGYGDINGGIAASRMELLANTLGLGVCYIGFLERAAGLNDKLKEKIGIKEGEDFVLAFVLGYPDVSYERMAARKKADVRLV